MDISGRTRLIGLLGYPISHSLSPKMHNSAFSYLGLEYAYLTFDTKEDNLEEVIRAMRALNVRGFNVTMPIKKNVLHLLDEVTPEAQMIGSVNTVLHENGKLIGYNTDGKGYVHDLMERGIEVKGKRFVLAGAGGAARSVAIQLAVDGASEIVIFNRTLEKAVEICNIIEKNIFTCKVEALELDENKLWEKLKTADVFINSTGLGMHPNEDQCVITNPGILHKDLIVTDLIYKPSKTKLLKMAEQAGCKAFNGLGMMIWQGAAAFKIWTGVDMPVDYIKNEVFAK